MTPPPPDPGDRSGVPPGAIVLAPAVDAREPLDIPRAVEDALACLPSAAARVTVLVNDPQRHTSTRPVLDALARRIPPGRMRIVVACGTHTTPTDQRAAFERSICGDLAPAALAWHDSRSDRLVPIGGGAAAAWRGHPWLLEADAILAIGSVEPHYFAGFTGAHKTATVGVAAYADVQANHALALDDRCQPAQVSTNPVACGILEMLACLEAHRPVAAVNLVQAGPLPIAAVGGRAGQALTAAAVPAERAFLRRIDRPADAIIAEVTGPLGESFYQADKGIKNNEWALRPGGCFVLVAPCPAGIGQDHFVHLLRQAGTYRQAVALVAANGYRLGDHKAVRLRQLTDPAARGVRAFLVSAGIAAADAALLGLTKAPTPAAALAAAAIDPARDRVYFLRDAGNLALLVDPGRPAKPV